jgi:glycosyltransferase involved in cell wall biosynthesis
VNARRAIKVLAISPIPEEGAGCRFRIAQFLPYLRDQGFDVTISPFYSNEFFRLVYRPGHTLRKAVIFLGLVWRRVVELLTIRQYDLVFLYREAIPVGPPIIERIIHWLGVPIVLDFDDAIFMTSFSDANRSVAFLKNPGRVATVLGLSRRASVGNEFLAAYARRHNAAVTVIPTVVDTTRFKPREDRTARKVPVVGWVGSPTTYQYLLKISDILREVAARHDFVLRISGAGQKVDIPGVTVEEAPWSMAEEVQLFNGLDIGVYPLTDDDWARGKCGFKAIQCMACGVPVVASAVGVNREIITDGVDSFLASTRQEWIDKLSRLLTEPGLRASMAAAGRQTIEQRYSLDVAAPQLATVMRAALEPHS